MSYTQSVFLFFFLIISNMQWIPSFSFVFKDIIAKQYAIIKQELLNPLSLTTEKLTDKSVLDQKLSTEKC